MSGLTAGHGLPYPTGQDLVADIPVYINALSAAVTAQLSAVPYVTRQVTVNCASGSFALSVPDFPTLAGVVFQPIGDVPMTCLVRAVAAKSVTGEIWQQDMNGAGYASRRFFGNYGLTMFAWGW